MHLFYAILHGMNDWDDLRIFLAIARRGNLTAAGKELSLTQPSVGRRLAALEDRLGGPLFLRSGRHWPLTDLGRDLAETAAPMQAAAEAIHRKATGYTQGNAGIVQLTSTDGLGAYFLPKISAELAISHPAITIEVLTGNRPLDLTRQGADIALRLYRPTEDDLVTRKLGTIPFGLFASPGYLSQQTVPNSLESLSGHRYIGQAQEYDNTAEFAWLRSFVPEPEFAFRSGSSVAQAMAARQDMGIALLPVYLAQAIGGLKEIRLEERPTGKDVWIATHRDLRRIPKIATVWEFLKFQASTDRLVFGEDEA